MKLTIKVYITFKLFYKNYLLCLLPVIIRFIINGKLRFPMFHEMLCIDITDNQIGSPLLFHKKQN